MQRNDNAFSSSLPEEVHSAVDVQHNVCRESDCPPHRDTGRQCSAVKEFCRERTSADVSRNLLNNSSGNLEKRAESQSPTQIHADTGGRVLKGESVAAAAVPPRMFYLTPVLRETFTAVGATNKAYSFREILQLLKVYLYSNRSLFDPSDVLYVNCGKDSLGQALGVERFHYNDVKPLLAKNIIPAEMVCEVTRTKSLPLSISGSGTKERIRDPNSRNDLGSNHSTLGVNSNTSETNDRTPLSPDDCSRTCSKTLGHTSASGTFDNPQKPQHIQGYLTTFPVPGSSRQTPEEITYRKYNQNKVLPSTFRKSAFPYVVKSGSESESTYSLKEYETALCFNTDYVESDACVEDNEADDDSVIENAGVAVLALHALCESERDFWPDDDNDTDESSETDDPELVAESWYCLSCSEKNKPFVRYCSKCWQLRKNWLPERSKKHKRRKPRPKNKKKSKTNVDISQVDIFRPCQINSKVHPLIKQDKQTPNTRDPLCSDVLTDNAPSTSYSLNRCGSQDSDIFSSQGNLTDLSQELKQEGSQDLNPACYLSDFPSTNFKDKSFASHSEKLPHCRITTKESACTSSQASSDQSEELMNTKDLKMSFTKKTAKATEETKRFFKFLTSKGGIRWLNSADGKCFLASQTFQEVLKKKVIRDSRNKSVIDLPQSSRWGSLLCSVCNMCPKNASIIHGRLSHQVTCYRCAQHLLNSGLPCPECHRKIHMVCKHILV
nr:E3 ubiquitin-protein ligase Mdm2-like [Procambarus clarkii]